MSWLIAFAFGLWLGVTGARSDDNAMANAYRQGAGVLAVPARAAALYRTTAEQGNVVAQLNLGDMMSRGVGVNKDAIGEYVWLGLAAEQGNFWAARRQREVARTMTATQIAIGDARIRDWKPKP